MQPVHNVSRPTGLFPDHKMKFTHFIKAPHLLLHTKISVLIIDGDFGRFQREIANRETHGRSI